jgi:hypothetical protein
MFSVLVQNKAAKVFVLLCAILPGGGIAGAMIGAKVAENLGAASLKDSLFHY